MHYSKEVNNRKKLKVITFALVLMSLVLIPSIAIAGEQADTTSKVTIELTVKEQTEIIEQYMSLERISYQ